MVALRALLAFGFAFPAWADRQLTVPFKAYNVRNYNNAGETMLCECVVYNAGNVSQPIEIRYLSGLNAPEGAVVGGAGFPLNPQRAFTLDAAQSYTVTWARRWNGTNVSPAATFPNDVPRAVQFKILSDRGAISANCRATSYFSSQVQSGLAYTFNMDVEVNGGRPF